MTLLTDILTNLHYGDKVLANELIELSSNTNFLQQWLCHAVSCNVNVSEMALVLSLVAYHDSDLLAPLHQFFTTYTTTAVTKVQCQSMQQHLISYPFLKNRVSPELVALWVGLISMQNPVLNSVGATWSFSQLVEPGAQILPAIRQSASDMQNAHVYSEMSLASTMSSIRNNQQFVVTLPTSSIIFALTQRLMCKDNFSLLDYAEPLLIYRYQVAEEYKWHCDFISPTNLAVKQELEFFGQRSQTRILYLNDNFTGGETAFKNWDLTLRPVSGAMLSFRNLDEQLMPDYSSVHAGLPVTSGEKWICTLFFRTRKNWLRRPLINY